MQFDMKGGGETPHSMGKESTELEAVDFDAFNSMFSLRKPRDIGAGLSSGTKSLVKGILAGTVSLVGAPVIGAVSEGWVGFAKGIALGEHALWLMLVLPLGCPLLGFLTTGQIHVRGI